MKELSRAQEWLPSEAAKAARRLLRAGLLRRQGDYLELSESGADQARELIRRHRLYESYLGELGYAADHQHGPADRVEHHLSPSLTAEMEAAVDFPERDPQGKPIPPAAR
ncbi:MAG: metal-dependent transcriptional regulator [Armatimonadota bacterium]